MSRLHALPLPLRASHSPLLLVAACLALLTACDSISSAPKDAADVPPGAYAPDAFAYATTQAVALRLSAQAGDGAPLAGVPLDVHLPGATPEAMGARVLAGTTDAAGRLAATVTLPAHVTHLVVAPRYLGLPRRAEVAIASGRATHAFRVGAGGASTSAALAPPKDGGFDYLGGFDAQGVPAYLDPVRDVVSADVLAVVNASLPEGQPLPASHPEYLAAGNELDLVLRDSAEVWITFVHEGAGWKNALGFYTYDADAPPASPAAIDARTIVFPNVSFAGEGGGLVAGDRVRLGAFPAGTALGWFLVGNGWTGSGVGAGYHTVYSNPAFNPEPDPALRQHNVLLADAARELVLLGFEDVRRDNIPIGCDQDFNDAVFYVTATPFEAVETAALPATDPDAEPVEEAFRTFAPGEGTFGTLAFEDLWPGRGDYDFNDLVVDYRFDLVAGADQRVTELRGRFVTRAVGASFRNGFGFALPVPPEAVAAVEGSDLQAGVVVTRANGTEAGQSDAVVIVYDDASRRLRRPSGYFANTQLGAPVVAPDTIDVTVRFAAPVDPGMLGAPPFNPFLIVNGRREKEVHLPDHPPTDLADASLFGTSADASRPAEGRFYKTDDNRPWALHLPSSFVYPVEKAAIEAGHLRFGAWARANGTRHADWYLDRAGYRDPAHLYDLD